MEIVLSLALGGFAGWVLYRVEKYFFSRSKRLSISIGFVLLTVGLSMAEFEVGGIHCGFSLLLVCMMTGTVFCNICDFSEELMGRVDSWTAPLFVLFFVLSGAELNLRVLSNPLVLLIGVVYIVSRSLGKYLGAYGSCKATGCSEGITKHLGITLLPQAGVALGMALTAQRLSDGEMVREQHEQRGRPAVHAAHELLGEVTDVAEHGAGHHAHQQQAEAAVERGWLWAWP